MTVNDLKLRTKAMIPLGLMATTLFALVAFGAVRLVGVSSEARDIIEKRDVAAVQISRAGRLVVQFPYDVDASILNDEKANASVAATKDIKAAPGETDLLLAAAAAELPDSAADIQKFRERAAMLGRQAIAILDDTASLPGVDHGRRLKPEELDQLAVATLRSADLDNDARKLIADMVAFNDKLREENVAVARSLGDASRNAVVALAAIGALSAAFALAFSFWMTAAKIERPLKRLGAQMRALAEGDLSADIEGRDRRDEIGDMAKAVEVFKTNALAQRRTEAQAAALRAANDQDRERETAQRLAAAQAQSAAMGALRDGLKHLAEGDLLVRLEQGFGQEFAEVRDDFNAAAAKLKTALAAVAQSTGAIHSSTREISSASDNLSQRTEQQAASLEETAAALEEITSTLKQSAQGAQHAAEVVAAADGDAKKGAVVVRKAVEAMDAIAESSNQIGQIIGVIDEIAFQTNLLALNAGVEAARAGDSGKGFAVVASEVRALAQRSAEAAKEIKALVSTSGAQVESGVKLVAESGRALESIIAQVSEINKVVAEIASGAQQQAAGLQQINAAISQMDQSTQQNATMVEESTAASHSLSQEMTELSKLVEQFRVGEPAEDRLRRDLKAAAPHAFAKAASPPARAANAAPRPVKAAANADWTEF